MNNINPYTGTPYERTMPTDCGKFTEHNAAHYRARWAKHPLKWKFFMDARWGSYAVKTKTTLRMK